MKISILTLFPEMFVGPFDHSIIKNAKIHKLIEIKLVNIRDFGIGKHKIVDDKPYGGGLGMIMRADVLYETIENAKDKTLSKSQQKVILLDPHGKRYTQNKAKELSTLKHLIFVCGHYEGVDERVKQFIDEEISIGDFIATGGEIPAMLITDSVTRLIQGVLKEGVTDQESFSKTIAFEYPHYTRPETFNNISVPKVLLSGDHKAIEAWKRENTKTY